jgi:hypothetical protein
MSNTTIAQRNVAHLGQDLIILCRQHRNQQRASLATAMQIARKLREIKDNCSQEEYVKFYEKAELSRQQVSDYLKLLDADTSHATSITQVVRDKTDTTGAPCPSTDKTDTVGSKSDATVRTDQGDDTPQIEEDMRREREAARNNGKVIFCARTLDNGFSSVVLQFANYGKTHPNKKTSRLYRSCDECLRVFRRDYEAMLRDEP